VYWHRQGKEALLQVKSRGVPKKEFMTGIDQVEYQFQLMHEKKVAPGDPILSSTVWDRDEEMWFKLQGVKHWPNFEVPVSFRMKSCKAALNEGDWSRAAVVQTEETVNQDSDPSSKRDRTFYNRGKSRIDTHLHIQSPDNAQTRYYGEVKYPPVNDDYGFEGSPLTFKELGPVITKTREAYDLPDNMEWELVWDGTEH
jgi:hypothetical protein